MGVSYTKCTNTPSCSKMMMNDLIGMKASKSREPSTKNTDSVMEIMNPIVQKLQII